MIKKFYMILSLVAGVAVGASDPVRAVESSLDLSSKALKNKVEKLINKYDEIIKLPKQESRDDVPFFLENRHKIEMFRDNRGVCVSLSAQWLSSIRQSESSEKGSDRFIDGLKWIADINTDNGINALEMAHLGDFCQKTIDIQSIFNHHLGDLLQNKCVKEKISAGCIKQIPQNSLKLSVLGEQPWHCQLVCYDDNRLNAIVKAFQQSPDEIQMIVVCSNLLTDKKQTIEKVAQAKPEDLPEYGHGVGLHFDPSTKRFYFYDCTEVSDYLREDDWSGPAGSDPEISGSLWTQDADFMAWKLWCFHTKWEDFFLVDGMITQCMIVANAPTIATFLDGQEEWLETLDDTQCVQRAVNRDSFVMLLLHAIRGVSQEIRDYVWGKMLSSTHEHWKRITGRELRGLDQEGGQWLYDNLMKRELSDVLTMLASVTRETLEKNSIAILQLCDIDLGSENRTPQEDELLNGLQQFLHTHQQCFANGPSQ